MALGSGIGCVMQIHSIALIVGAAMAVYRVALIVDPRAEQRCPEGFGSSLGTNANVNTVF